MILNHSAKSVEPCGPPTRAVLFSVVFPAKEQNPKKDHMAVWHSRRKNITKRRQ